MQGTMRRQTEYEHPRQHNTRYNEKTNRIRPSETTYNTRYNEKTNRIRTSETTYGTRYN